MSNYGYLLKLLNVLGVISYQRRLAAAFNTPQIIFLHDLEKTEAKLKLEPESGVGAHSGDK